MAHTLHPYRPIVAWNGFDAARVARRLVRQLADELRLWDAASDARAAVDREVRP